MVLRGQLEVAVNGEQISAVGDYKTDSDNLSVVYWVARKYGLPSTVLFPLMGSASGLQKEELRQRFLQFLKALPISYH